MPLTPVSTFGNVLVRMRCVRTAQLGQSTSGTGSFQNLTDLPEGTNVRKRKSSEVSIQQTNATTTQHALGHYQALVSYTACSNFACKPSIYY